MMVGSKKRMPGSLRILCDAAPDFGVEPDQCLEGTGLVVFDLYDSDAEVTLSQELRAISNFLTLAPDRPGLGIEIGRRYRPQVFGIWGYAILSSPTFRAALNTAMEFANLSFIIATVSLDESEDRAVLRFASEGLPSQSKPFILQRHLTVLSNFTGALLPGFSLPQFRFETTLVDPQAAKAIEKGLGIKTTLNCAHDLLVLPLEFLDTDLPRHDPKVMEACLNQCRELLKRDTVEQTWTDKVRDVALMELGNAPSIVSTASKLGVTERTLRRRLSEEGASFREILVEARLAIGHELLSTAKLDVSTVAYRTGYSEPSSFVRAFSQRYGYSPGRVKFGAKEDL